MTSISNSPVTSTSRPEPILFLSDSRGIYIPRDFAESIDRARVQGVSEEDWSVLTAGPENEFYWDVWDEVSNDAEVIDEHGQRYNIWLDGDCWLIPVEMTWDEARGFFFWEDEQ